jgi:hypothetical protein
VARYVQPQVSRQHQAVRPNALAYTAVTQAISQYLPHLPAAESFAAQRAQGEFGGRECVDFESAQYRLAVLAAQPPGHGGVGV